jgi:hypothetical protein
MRGRALAPLFERLWFWGFLRMFLLDWMVWFFLRSGWFRSALRFF